jgi:hypothetical protein
MNSGDIRNRPTLTSQAQSHSLSGSRRMAPQGCLEGLQRGLPEQRIVVRCRPMHGVLRSWSPVFPGPESRLASASLRLQRPPLVGVCRRPISNGWRNSKSTSRFPARDIDRRSPCPVTNCGIRTNIVRHDLPLVTNQSQRESPPHSRGERTLLEQRPHVPLKAHMAAAALQNHLRTTGQNPSDQSKTR